MIPVALGEQTGGSGLRPAAFCGVAALKPTYGRISRAGCYPFSLSFDHPVIIATDLADVALLLSVLSGHDPADPDSLRDEAPSPDLRLGELSAPRIGLVENFVPDRAEAVMRAAVAAAAVRLERGGAHVVSVRLPEDFVLASEVHRIIGRAEGAVINQGVIRDRGTGLNEWQLENIVGGLIPASYYLHAQRIRRRLCREIAKSFDDVDALLMAAVPGPAPMGLSSSGDPSLLIPWTALGLPTITVNGGSSPEGLPLGLQLIARDKADHRLCQVAAWCESVLGRFPAPSVRPA